MSFTIRYHPSETFEKELEDASDTKVVLMEACVKSAQRARTFVPRGTRGRQVRSYYAYFEGKDVLLMSNSSFWHLLEYGSTHNPPWAPLRLGVESAGCLFVDASK